MNVYVYIYETSLYVIEVYLSYWLRDQYVLNSIIILIYILMYSINKILKISNFYFYSYKILILNKIKIHIIYKIFEITTKYLYIAVSITISLFK